MLHQDVPIHWWTSLWCTNMPYQKNKLKEYLWSLNDHSVSSEQTICIYTVQNKHNWLLFIMTAVQSPLPCCIFCTTLLSMFYLCRFSESRSSSGSTLSVGLSATLLGCLVCVICNSWSFHSFLFKLCIMAVHILKMCTSYFVHIRLIFSHFLRVLDLRHFSIRNG